MGLRKDALAAAAQRLGADQERLDRVAAGHQASIAEFHAELEAWSERTGIPIRRKKALEGSEKMYLRMQFRTDDKIWLIAQWHVYYTGRFDEIMEWEFEVTCLEPYSRLPINSVSDLGIALSGPR